MFSFKNKCDEYLSNQIAAHLQWISLRAKRGKDPAIVFELCGTDSVIPVLFASLFSGVPYRMEYEKLISLCCANDP